jgi:hypothetical protein
MKIKTNKILLNIDNIYLDEIYENIYGDIKDHKYKLIRQNDGLTRTSLDIKWISFNEEGKYLGQYNDINIGRSLLMSPFNNHFTWQTTLVTEIVEQREDYIKFKTKNSIYELIKIK